MKRKFRSTLLSLLLLFALLPATTLSVMAASGTLTLSSDSKIGLSYSGDGTWTAGADSVAGSVTATSGWFGSTSNKNATLTITNNSGEKRQLSFDYVSTNVSNSSDDFKLGGTGGYGTGSGNIKVTLNAGATYTVYIQSRNKSTPTTVTLTNIKLQPISEKITVTFHSPENGSYTVAGESITQETVKTLDANTTYTLEATPVGGYALYGWLDGDGNLLSAEGATTFAWTTGGVNCEVYPLFYKAGGDTFSVGGDKFDDLNVATIVAKNRTDHTVILCKNATLPAGEYTIPGGVTLLIPCDTPNTAYITEPGLTASSAWSETPTVFRSLTLATGASITVNGAISVAAVVENYMSGGCTRGAVGQIALESGSSITVNSNGTLYCWGYITGDGNVTVESGGTVWEMLQVADWRGGTEVYNMRNNSDDVFPFSQYYIQNIQASMKIKAGATESVYLAAYVGGTDILQPAEIIGDNGLFQISSGSMTKWYDAERDRIVCDVDGDLSIAGLTVAIDYKILWTSSFTLKSSDFVFPFPGHFTFNVNSGTTSLTQNVAFLPGAELNIAQGAVVEVASGKSTYVYDLDDWGTYCHKPDGAEVKLVPALAALGRQYTRTEADLADAKLDVNGTLNVKGYLYTTNSGANITSSDGTGKVVLSGNVGTTTKTYQYDGSDYQSIAITAAKLHNENKDTSAGEYITTESSSTYYYCKTKCGGVWHKVGAVNVAEVGGTQYTTLTEAVGAANGATVTMLHDTTEGTIDMSNLVLDLAGCAVNADLTGSFSGFDTSGGYGEVDGKMVYTTPTGKITGSVDSVNKTYQTATSGAFQRYVAITNADGETSFHRFNISVTSFRTLFNPSDGGRGALHFEALFRGDGAVMGEVKEIGFTLTYAGSKATDTPTTTKPIQNSELFISDAVWDKTLTADNVAEDCTATAYIKFDDSAKGTVTSLPQSITYLQALKTAYANPMMLSMTNTESTLRPTEVIDDFMATYGEALGWDSATALTAYEYVA